MSTRTPPTDSKMPRPRLRLTRDDSDGSTPRVEVIGSLGVSGSRAARTRLVAGVVDLPATPDEDTSAGSHLSVIGRIGPDEFLRGLESTLERMQGKLDELTRDVDDAFKFPTAPFDDDAPRPRAA